MNKSKVIRKRQQKKNNRKSNRNNNRKSNRKGSKKLKNVKKQKGGQGEELFGRLGDSFSFIGTKKAVGLFGGESRLMQDWPFLCCIIPKQFLVMISLS